ncbi:MAG: hypothetical protein WC314_03270 [Vulcanimicrobiota bacterium]
MPSIPQALLLFLLLPFGCNGPITSKPKVPPVTTPKTEFRANFFDHDQQLDPIEISTVQGRFRLERDGKVFVGDLDPKGEVAVLNPEKRTYFQYQPTRFSSLFSTHDRPAATRYEGAVRSSGLRTVSERVALAFRSPCDAATEWRQDHRICEWMESGPDLRTFTHEFFGRKSMREGFEKTRSSVTHVYNTKLGVLMDGPQGGYLRDIEIADIADDRFEIPPGYVDLVSDEVLRDPRFGYIGSFDMLQGVELEPFMEFVIQTPPVPAPPEWIYQKEKWWVKGDSSRWLFIERSYPLAHFDPRQVPFNIDHRFQVKAWDEHPEVGELSMRDPKGNLVFYGKGQLFKLTLPEEFFGDLEVELAEKLLSKVSKASPHPKPKQRG